MEINRPDVLAQMQAMFARYEAALVANDVDALNELFWQDPRTIRYGIAEDLYGFDAIASYRRAHAQDKLERTLARTVITTYGEDFATASTEFVRSPGTIGRQMQSWVRMPQGWRVVAAHVSVIPDPAGR